MDAIDCLLSRNACSRLSAPAPSEQEQKTILSAALRAPDHARLRPWRFISIQGEDLEQFADIYQAFAEQQAVLSEQEIEKARAKAFRAPWLIVVVAQLQQHPKVPEIEQYLSAGAAAQNILLASHALGYGAIWRTGDFAYTQQTHAMLSLKENEKIVSLLFVGTINQTLKPLPQMNVADYVSTLSKGSSS